MWKLKNVCTVVVAAVAVADHDEVIEVIRRWMATVFVYIYIYICRMN